MPKILFVEVEKWEKRELDAFEDEDSVVFAGKLDEYKDDLGGVTVLSTFINSQLDKEGLSRLPKLKFIATRSTGYDHIDLAWCRQRGIIVANVPAYGTATVAEHAMALLLSISRRIVESVERTKTGNFDFHELSGFDLEGKILGVVGTGKIGLHVAKIAKGFGLTVLGFDVYPNKDEAAKIGLLYVPLNQLLKSSDIVTLHLPYMKETHHFLGADEFAKMKKGVVLINTARGALVETPALLAALEDGTVKAAGLDVLEEEGLLKEEHELLGQNLSKKNLLTALEGHALLHHPKVLVTPHNAFNSAESLKRITQTTLDNIRAYFAGKPVNIVKETS